MGLLVLGSVVGVVAEMAFRDVALVGILVFALGVGFLSLHYVFNNSVDVMLGVGEINESADTVSALGSAKDLTGRLDWVVFGIFIGLVLAMLISAWFIPGHPIFMFVYFLAVLVIVVVGAVLSNAWETFSGTAPISASASAFSITNHLLNNLPLYLGVAGFLGMVILFGKPRDGVGL